MTRRTKIRPRIEGLEQRLVLAGNIAASLSA
jgi:hypothetical protein